MAVTTCFSIEKFARRGALLTLGLSGAAVLWYFAKRLPQAYRDDAKSRRLALKLHQHEGITIQQRHSLKDHDFRFEPLSPDPAAKAMRVIELLPNPENERGIQIVLHTSSLAEGEMRMEYEAISYCWGESEDLAPVFCGESIIWVTANLFRAFRRFRLSDRSRFIWADAVCINQNDLLEKSHQVRMMAEIYKNATKVLIWLGEESSEKWWAPDETWRLEEFIIRLLESKLEKDRAGDKHQYWELTSSQRLAYGIPSVTDKGYTVLGQLIDRPWFRRVWVIQEVALAKEAIVYCSHWYLNWDLICVAYRFASGELGLEPTLRASGWEHNEIIFMEAMRDSVAKAASRPLLQLLINHREAKASDLRDKVFALCGLATDVQQGSLQIDYDYTSTVKRLYLDTTIAIMLSSRTLGILSICGRESEEENDIPSWVPNLLRNECPFPLCQTSYDDKPIFPFNATLESQASPKFSKDRTQIGLLGYEIDKIAQVGSLAQYIDHEKGSIGTLKRYGGLFDLLRGWNRIRSTFMDTAISQDRAAAIDMFVDTMGLGEDNPEVARSVRDFVAFEESHAGSYFLGGHSFFEAWPRLKVLRQLLCLFAYVRYTGGSRFMEGMPAVLGRRLFTTEAGNMGLATGAVRPGDAIVLFEGGRVPFTIRQQIPPRSTILVGDVYLRGHMHGESWDPGRGEFIWLA